MTRKPKAFLFDLNGTMIDDMKFHLQVWHNVLTKELGSSLSLEEVRGHMYGKNHELLVRVFGKDRFTLQEMDTISHRKEEQYQELFKPHLQLLPGLPEFLEKALRKDVKMAIGSAAIPFNINFVLDNLDLHRYFGAIVSAEDVAKSKPHPETFLKAASKLNAEPADCVVFEDAPKGVEAAMNAGMKSVVLTTMHHQEEFKAYDNILMFIKDYNDPAVQELL